MDRHGTPEHEEDRCRLNLAPTPRCAKDLKVRANCRDCPLILWFISLILLVKRYDERRSGAALVTKSARHQWTICCEGSLVGEQSVFLSLLSCCPSGFLPPATRPP